ncbi:MAG: DJ-1 family glyoxalase III [Methanothrix sp.]|jgi:4-methyl-5(b-hydroxyethyl)-thiazole monophosphate biosynthesis|nr:DJ-1/PfpI family protein [Methanothrix sp.]MDD5767813.1 DJ-1/PfpI family protein [Methanothrix sp.]MDI9398577.1 DJ-1/PfpI family protein [Euryarchaeota archaeon]
MKGGGRRVKVVVPMAEGFEEIEFVTIVDILRRAEVEVVTACLDERKVPGQEIRAVEGSHGIKFVPDAAIDEIDPEEFDAIILPGGFPGFVTLGEDERVLDLIRRMNGAGKHIAAICGAPSVLVKAGIIEGKKATIHPAGRKDLTDDQYVDDRVVVSGKLITSKAAGTAMEFALRLVGELIGEERMRKLAEEILAECEV